MRACTVGDPSFGVCGQARTHPALERLDVSGCHRGDCGAKRGGMLNAPATGEAMAELILDGKARGIDLAPFAPGRLRTLDAAQLKGVRLRGP